MDDGDMESLIHRLVYNQELHAAIVLGLACVGAWVVLTWFIQILFSIVWPFFAFIAIMILMPTWRRTLVNEIYPKYSEVFRNLLNRMLLAYNNARNETNTNLN